MAAIRHAGTDPDRVRSYLRMERLFGRAPSAEELQDDMALPNRDEGLREEAPARARSSLRSRQTV